MYGTESKFKITISDNGPDLPGMDWARLRQHRGGKSWARTQAPGETRTDCDKIERTDALTAAPRSSDDGLNILQYYWQSLTIFMIRGPIPYPNHIMGTNWNLLYLL